MNQISLIQENNTQFIDYEPSPKLEGAPDDRHLPDVDRVVKRLGVYASNKLDWLELSVNWMPFVQVSDCQRSFWSKARLVKALDRAIAAGLVADLKGDFCHFKLTNAGAERLREIV